MLKICRLQINEGTGIEEQSRLSQLISSFLDMLNENRIGLTYYNNESIYRPISATTGNIEGNIVCFSQRVNEKMKEVGSFGI